MTQVTDRISNSDIVDLAKKQFELTKKQKIPTVVVNLSSKGLIYPESHPLRKGYVHMRHMCAYDEDILINDTYMNKGITFDVLLAELITDDIDISDIAIVDREGLIINCYILGFGADYTIVASDPKTNNTITRDINLNNLLTKNFDLVSDKNGEFSYTVNAETTIKFRYITMDHENLDESKVISSFLHKCITEVNGDRSIAAIEDFLRYNFSPGDSRKFRKYYTDNAPGLQTEIELKGEDGDTFQTGFRFNTAVFWT